MRFQTREKGGATILFEMAFRPRVRSGFRVLLTRFYYGYIFIHNAKVNAAEFLLLLLLLLLLLALLFRICGRVSLVLCSSPRTCSRERKRERDVYGQTLAIRATM